MAQATFYCSYGSDRNAALSGDPDDLSIRRLTALLTSLLDEPRAPSLPDWTYRTWCLALQYRELNPRAQASTKELASRRDQALSHPEVRQLVEWAGSRRRDNPAVGAAAALTTVRLAQRRSRFASMDVAELGRRVAVEADAARPVRFSPSPLPSQRARVRLPYSDWDAAAEEEPTRRENPRLASTVGELLALAGADSNSSLSAIEAAVIQAGDWWARHALPVPTSVDGPRLPGVIPGEQLESCDRLSVQIPDPTLLSLVTGPHPGRCRGRQVAWRRGLTFWVAARLASPDATRQPPPETIRWWCTQLAVLALRPAKMSVSSRGGYLKTVGIR
jgi:hypothetical protein